MGNKKVLCFEITESLCSAVLCTYDNYRKETVLKEIYRFRNNSVLINGHRYRDIIALIGNIKKGILKAINDTGKIDSIGISTYGMEYGLLDKYGCLIGNTFCYDDIRTDDIINKVLRFVKEDDIFWVTGSVLYNYSSMVQLMAENDKRPYILDNTHTFLMLPDLIRYILTGEKHTEYTNACSSQLMNCEKKEWSSKIISMLGFKRNIFPDIISEGSFKLLPEISDELKCESFDVKVTGSVISDISVLLEKYDNAVIIDSRNSVTNISICSETPVLSKTAYEGGYENSIIYNGKYMITYRENGCKLIDATIKCFNDRNIICDHKKLEGTAVLAEPYKCCINPHSEFLANSDNIPIAIQNYCKNSNQFVPQNVSEMTRCLFESIAFQYASTIENLSRITLKECKYICMTGSDSSNAIICQALADICNVKVIGGLEKALLYGNIVHQIKDKNDTADDIIDVLISCDENVKEYIPDKESGALAAYYSYLSSQRDTAASVY